MPYLFSQHTYMLPGVVQQARIKYNRHGIRFDLSVQAVWKGFA